MVIYEIGCRKKAKEVMAFKQIYFNFKVNGHEHDYGFTSIENRKFFVHISGWYS